MSTRTYNYVGPASLKETAKTLLEGVRVTSLEVLRNWLAALTTDQMRDGTMIATFVIDLQGDLLLAPRRSEHVACASGGPVLSAGEMSFDKRLTVTEISNQSTGFCPEPEFWSCVASALDRLGLKHPSQFTLEIVFRLCTNCGERNIVKDDWYCCTLCEAELPRQWNFPSI